MKPAGGSWQNRRIREPTEFALDGNIGELARLAQEISRFCRHNDLGGEILFELNLALEELFANAVRHGGCEGMNGAVRIRLERLGPLLRIEYADRGQPFDPTTASLPDFPAPLGRTPGGLGVHLLRQLMPRMEYRRDGEWNRLTLERAARASAAPEVGS